MADYYWVGGTATWDSTAGTKWATTSGGTTYYSTPPSASDSVFFTSATSYTVTMTGALTCLDFNVTSGTVTFATGTTPTLAISGNMNITGVTPTWNSTGTITFNATTTKTIKTNSTIFNCSFVFSGVNGYWTLSDALTLASSYSITLTNGTFDAATFNVTAGAFSSSNSNTRTVNLGTGVWTLSGTGTVWNTSTFTNCNLYGTAEIVLSDNTTASRVVSAGVSAGVWPVFSKITIGGSSSTSQTDFLGGQYNEIATTKTVAHTIRFSAGAYCSIGKWSITGTAGNIVTLTSTIPGTATSLYLIGSRVVSDYLNVSNITVANKTVSGAQISGAEFYAGANSTNGGTNTNVIFTAAPTPRTLYWVGGTGNWSDTNRWSTASGGAGGAAIPTSVDDVVFDTSSSTANAAYTVTIDANAVCGKFTMNGPGAGNKVTLAGTSVVLFVHDNFSFSGGTAGITLTYTGAYYFGGSTTGKTINLNGVSLLSASSTQLYGVGSLWTLTSDFITIASSHSFTVRNGSLNTNGFALTVGSFNSSFLNFYNPIRSISFGSSNITTFLSSTTFSVSAQNLTFNAGTSTINPGSGASSSITTINGSLTFYNIAFGTGSTTVQFNGTGTMTCNNLTIGGRTSIGMSSVLLAINMVVNGTLSVNAGATAPTMRVLITSDTLGVQRTITSANNTIYHSDFRNIVGAGTGSWAGNGTRGSTACWGDALGNSGITFASPMNIYWVSTTGTTWNANAWSDSSTGTANTNFFPLPQDNVIFTNLRGDSGITVNNSLGYSIGNITFDDGINPRTLPITWSNTGSPTIYKNVTLTSAVTLSGTATLTFSGQGLTQTIKSAGVSFASSLIVNSPGGSVTLSDNLVIPSTSTFTLFAGTLDINNLLLTCGLFASSNTNARTLAFGNSGSMSLSGVGTISIWDTSTATNMIVTGSKKVQLTATTPVSGTTRVIRTGITAAGGTGTTPEDQAVSFEILGGSDTVSIANSNSTGGGLLDLDTTNFNGTLTAGAFIWLYGSFTLGTNVTFTFSNYIYFVSTKPTVRTVDLKGRIVAGQLGFSGLGGTWKLLSNCGSSVSAVSSIYLGGGTLDLNGYKFSGFSFATNNSGAKSLVFNGGTIELNGTGATVWTVDPPTFSLSAGNSPGVISMTGATAKIFAGGGLTYPCAINQGGAGLLTITGNNSFTRITNTVSPATISLTSGTTTVVSKLGLAGSSAANKITLNSTSASSAATLSCASGMVYVKNCDIVDNNAIGGAIFRAPTNYNNTTTRSPNWITTAWGTPDGTFFAFF